MTIQKSNQKLTNIVILMGWMGPIIASQQYGRFEIHGVSTVYVKLMLSLSIIMCLAYFILFLKKHNAANKYALALLLFIYIHALLSNVTEYTQVIFYAVYAYLVHMIGYNYPKVLFRQYITMCKIICGLVIVDYIAYLLIGNTLILWRPTDLVSGIPRIHSFFDEPFHQASFLMPALLWYLFGNKKRDRVTLFLLLFPYLATLSTAAILLLVFPTAYFYFIKQRITVIRLISVLIISLIIITISGPYMISKLSTVTNIEFYENYKKVSSGANYVALYDIVRNARVQDIILGVGYFNVGDVMADYLVFSNLSNYYSIMGYYDGDFVSFGLISILFSYGLIGVLLMWYFIHNMYRSPRELRLSTFTVWAILLSLAKISHTLGNLILILFLFGLFWGIPVKSSAPKLISMRRRGNKNPSNRLISKTIPRETAH